MANDNAFGRYLRHARTSARLSLRAVADKLGVTHVYLGEVERGVRGPLKRSYFSKLAKIISGVTVKALEHHADRSRSVQLSIEDAPPQYQDLALSLARRIQSQDMAARDLRSVMDLLQKYDDDE